MSRCDCVSSIESKEIHTAICVLCFPNAQHNGPQLLFCCISWETRWHCLRGSFGSHQQLIVFQHPSTSWSESSLEMMTRKFQQILSVEQIGSWGKFFFFSTSFIHEISNSREQIYEFTCIFVVSELNSFVIDGENEWEISCDLVSLQKVLVYSYCVRIYLRSLSSVFIVQERWWSADDDDRLDLVAVEP